MAQRTMRIMWKNSGKNIHGRFSSINAKRGITLRAKFGMPSAYKASHLYDSQEKILSSW